ncbi:Glutamyl-tRNA amidotransferase subunit A, mitochondrial [Crepidotus variabilis]|uniref:Glutamyl-tRNA(Gln) amidotransferase subunit A, mitochondrial n=1 Tax=Crepidotus variabilis TaxID=179855 RepID=A0A9P6EBH6_9AGAR|nr:Glutamyl-tRNA amidotransferase subunit A, mitochondrial [Crepidotus variabilis]
MRPNVVAQTRYIRRLSSRRAQAHYSTQQALRQQLVEPNATVNAFVNLALSPKISQQTGRLAGLNIAVKDNIATKELPTTCSSAMLKDFVSPFDATCVQLLKSSGATVVGKTNCDEFGMGSLNIHSIHGPVVNPFDTTDPRSAGGSSGGSAAAVAAGMCDAALGTDTGGSVRLPASYCGVVGFKPSYGLISRQAVWGVVSYADSLDCVGVLGSDVAISLRVFEALCEYDPRDPTAAPPEIREDAFAHASTRLSSLGSEMTGLRIGIPQEYFPKELSQEVIEPFRQVILQLKEQGAIIVPVSLPSTSYALSSYYVLASAEASSNLARYDGIQYGSYVRPSPSTDLSITANVYAQSRSQGFGAEVQKRMLLGTYALSADAFDNYFLQAQRVRQMIKNDFDRVFSMSNYFSDAVPSDGSFTAARQVDVLLHPSAIRTAPSLSINEKVEADLSSYVQDVLTVPASLAGLPAVSVPLGKYESAVKGDTRWPIGVSVVGQWGTDRLVLKVGRLLESLAK